MISITPQQLRKAANIQEKIQELQKELEQILGVVEETPPTKAPKRRKMSAAGRGAIAAAAKARWAKYRAAKGEPVKKARTKISAKGLANIRAAQLARRARERGEAVTKAPTAKPKKKQVSQAKLRALAKARAARWAKGKAA